MLISPLSIQLALTMTANGAAGETRREMEALLGGGMPLGTLNEYLSAYADALPSGEGYKLALANSIWLRDTPTLRVEKDFLQTNADYYGAQIYKAAFDGQTLPGHQRMGPAENRREHRPRSGGASRRSEALSHQHALL